MSRNLTTSHNPLLIQVLKKSCDSQPCLWSFFKRGIRLDTHPRLLPNGYPTYCLQHAQSHLTLWLSKDTAMVAIVYLPTQEWNPCLPQWQVDSFLLHLLGSPTLQYLPFQIVNKIFIF